MSVQEAQACRAWPRNVELSTQDAYDVWAYLLARSDDETLSPDRQARAGELADLVRRAQEAASYASTLPPAPSLALTPEERESLTVWAFILSDEHARAFAPLTGGRPLAERLNLCESVKDAAGIWRQEPLTAVSVADLLLFRRVFLAALTPASDQPAGVLQLGVGTIGHRILAAIGGPEGRCGLNPHKLVLMLMPDVHHSNTERAVQELARQGLVYSFPGMYGTPVLALTVPGEKELARLQVLAAVPGGEG